MIVFETNYKKFPEGCFSCRFYSICGTHKKLSGEEKTKIVPKDCPLIQMPDKKEAEKIIALACMSWVNSPAKMTAYHCEEVARLQRSIFEYALAELGYREGGG